jgi:N-terminal domain of anti-restriction factor ArdC
MATGNGTSNGHRTFATMLQTAVTEPGLISRAYTAFHGFSLRNQILAAMQCAERSIPVGPLATFAGWKGKGRHVKRGEKALSLWRPITVKRPADEPDDEPAVVTRFVLRPFSFTLAQTDGQAVEPIVSPAWDRARALAALNVTEVPFAHADGNVQGYAHGRAIAISPVATMPHKTTFHELAHVMLGHTDQAMSDGGELPRNLREVEAESVALLCLESLGLPGAEFCRGYIQHWLGTQSIPDASACRIFKAADQILREGIQRELGQIVDEISA